MKKDLRKNIVWLIIGGLLIILYKMLDNYEIFFLAWNKFKSLMSPFVWGFVLSYFLIIIMRKIEIKFKFNRIISLLLTYTIFFISILIIIRLVAPVIIDNIFDLINNLPSRVVFVQDWINELIKKERLIKDFRLEEYFNKDIGNYTSVIVDFLNRSLNSILNGVISITSGVFSFIIGVIISIYILLDIDKFSDRGRRITLAFFGKNKSDEIFKFIGLCDSIFKNFFVGKAIDSLIIGILCYIGLLVIKAPYAMLSSLIVGIFNMIPYVGPIIGAIPAIVLTVFVEPSKTIWVAIFIFILQQIDGNIIGPKILGDKVGISPFSIILAITIGGGYFGIIGMLLAVPIYKVIGVVFDRYIEKRIDKLSS